MRSYLNKVSSLENTKYPVDNKSIMDYYVDNNAALVSRNTWHHEDKNIVFDKQWTIDDFLVGEDWRIVIRAPFGIGKTSLVTHIAASYAKNHLNEPIGLHNYIPVMVRLRDNLKNVFNDNDLDAVLDSIVAPEIGKKRKILLICDGLDEHGANNDTLIQYLERKHKELTNMKVIITTRLEAGIPHKLRFKNCVRLLPFDYRQVNDFFRKYYYPKATPIKFENLSTYGNLCVMSILFALIQG